MKKKIETVFYCKACEIAKASNRKTLKCPSCREPMEYAGWIETRSTK